MTADEKVNILMVDDQPGKLLSYEVILAELGENLIKATSASEALNILLKTDIAVVLMDVSMPDVDGFELAAVIRQHPRFQKTAIIFISGVHLTDSDRIQGYRSGAVDYISVPVVPEVLRAKIGVFVELHRKTRMLESLNLGLERRVIERTEELRKSEMAISYARGAARGCIGSHHSARCRTAASSFGTPARRTSTVGRARKRLAATFTLSCKRSFRFRSKRSYAPSRSNEAGRAI